MKRLTILLCWMCAVQAGAQSFEYFEDEGYRNEFTDVINVGDSIWVVTGNYRDEFYTGAYITAFDNTGSQIWRYSAPTDIEVRRFEEVVQMPNGNLVVFGREQFCCDCTAPYAQLQFFSPDGAWLGSNEFPDYTPIRMEFAVSDETILLNGYHESGPRLFAVDLNGEWLWSLNINDQDLHHVVTHETGFAAFFDSFAFQIDSSGTITDTLQYETPPLDVVASGDSILLLFEYGLYVINDSMEQEFIFSPDHTLGVSKIIVGEDGYFLWNDSSFFRFDESHQLMDTLMIETLPDFEIADIAIGSGSLTLAGCRRFEDVPPDYQIYRGATLQSISLQENTDSIFPDLALKNVVMNDMVITTVDPDVPIFHVTGTVSAYVVNIGNITIQAANINEMHSQGTCGVAIHRVALDSMNLNPGDSLYITQEFGPIYYYDFMDVMFGKACIFVSSPDSLHDREDANDIGCAPFDIVTVVEERKIQLAVYPNPASDRLTIELPELPAPAQIQVFNSTGIVVAEFTAPSQTFSLEVNSWPAGIYYARTITNGSVSPALRFSVVH